ncbi:MAG: hypothetical protein O2960_01980 [Verrucomicrobia bacterium]|nr:hypothetical protein [Verrucomicrobiota bacterium]
MKLVTIQKTDLSSLRQRIHLVVLLLIAAFVFGVGVWFAPPTRWNLGFRHSAATNPAALRDVLSFQGFYRSQLERVQIIEIQLGQHVFTATLETYQLW